MSIFKRKQKDSESLTERMKVALKYDEVKEAEYLSRALKILSEVGFMTLEDWRKEYNNQLPKNKRVENNIFARFVGQLKPLIRQSDTTQYKTHALTVYEINPILTSVVLEKSGKVYGDVFLPTLVFVIDLMYFFIVSRLRFYMFYAHDILKLNVILIGIYILFSHKLMSIGN